MAVKRVTDFYAKGSLASTRRTPQSAGARTPTQTTSDRPAPVNKPAPPPRGLEPKVSESVVAAMTADLAALHGVPPTVGAAPAVPQEEAKPAISENIITAIAADLVQLAQAPEPNLKPPPSPPRKEGTVANARAAIAANLNRFRRAKAEEDSSVAVDYQEIVAKTVATLEHNTVEARHAVYECARQVVHQQLSGLRPALTPDNIERERTALDRAIDKIESAALKRQAAAPDAAPATPAAAKPMAPVVISTRRRNLPHAKHLHSGTLRLFAIVGLVCAGTFVYWLVAGQPYLPGATSADHTNGEATPSNSADVPTSDIAQSYAPNADSRQPQKKAETQVSPPSTSAAIGSADTNEAARALASNPLMNLKVECGGVACGTGYVAPLSPATGSDGAAWVASYGTIKSPSGSSPPPATNTKETAKLLETGRAAAVPTAAGLYERGTAKAKNGDTDGAIRDFTEAIRLDPNFADAFVQRGNARFKNGSPDLALVDFSDALGIDARHAAALKARGMARLYNADEDGALDDLSKAIQIAESEPVRLPILDVFFARRTRTGINSRRQAGDRELFDLSAMIDAYWKNPDLADALKANYGIQGGSALMATIYRQRAALYVQRANADGAIADLSFALQLDPARGIQLIMERARVQEAAGKREQAAADFQRVLQINPRIEEAKQAIARLNAKQ